MTANSTGWVNVCWILLHVNLLESKWNSYRNSMCCRMTPFPLGEVSALAPKYFELTPLSGRDSTKIKNCLGTIHTDIWHQILKIRRGQNECKQMSYVDGFLYVREWGKIICTNIFNCSASNTHSARLGHAKKLFIRKFPLKWGIVRFCRSYITRDMGQNVSSRFYEFFKNL